MNSQSPTNTNKPKVLAISTYELGQQPLVLARIATLLDTEGIDYALCDNSVANRSFEQVEDFCLTDGTRPTHILISVPMHTATQLGRKIAQKARALFGDSVVVIAVGLYAKVALSMQSLFDLGIDSLTHKSLLDSLGVENTHKANTPDEKPNRNALPTITNYAHLMLENEKRLVGYVETTTGCAHTCRHCPVPVVHDGKFKAVRSDIVLAEIAELYQQGARHITFGDPDFFNGPTHALKIVRQMHKSWPDLSFDATIKVEHVLEHPDIWNEMRESGLEFIVSAFEHTSDYILNKLAKGHTKYDIVEALDILRLAGIEVRPSLLPFTPWTNKENLLELIEFIFDNDLVGSIDPVQMSIRLLIPLGSLLMADPQLKLGSWNPESLSYEWRSDDPKIDTLQAKFSDIAQESDKRQENPIMTFVKMREAAYAHFGMEAPVREIPIIDICSKPRLSESWFCCAEPTENQLSQIK